MLPPTAWLSPLLAERAVLFINHVLYAEPMALARLKPHAGKLVMLQLEMPRWLMGASVDGGASADGVWAQSLRVSPAGLFELVVADQNSGNEPANLNVTVDISQPLAVMQRLMSGVQPAVRIDGDADLATDVAWLADNLRWDFEEDLARVFGDAWAHESVSRAKTAASALRDMAVGLLSRPRVR